MILVLAGVERNIKIYECFQEIEFDENNIVNEANKVQKGIKRFNEKRKNKGIEQVGEDIASYFLRDLVTQNNHLDIKYDKGGLNSYFSRFCFKKDSNANKFIYITGLILLPSILYDKIDNLIHESELNNREKKKYLDCLKFSKLCKDNYIKRDHNWKRFIDSIENDINNYSKNSEMHILVKVALDMLFDNNTNREKYYKENFGLLNEIFYLKCQAHCSSSSQYLCWNDFKPQNEPDERPPIYSFCNVAHYCLLTKSID